jgi:hypothetical protein
MEKAKKQRVKALKALNGMMNVEMTGLRDEQRQAAERLYQLEQRMAVLEREIEDAEQRVRTVLGVGSNLVLEEYQMLLTYLEQKQRLKVNHERQIGFARERFEKIGEALVQQGLKIRGVEHTLERRLDELRLERENKQLSQLDEAWLLNSGERQ